MYFAAVGIAIFVLLGCKGPRPYTANASGESVAKSSAFIAAASANIDAAKPDTGRTGKALLNVADDQLTSATKENDAASKQIHATQKQLADAVQGWAKEREHWLGYKTRVLGWWIIGIASGLYLALGIAGIFLPVGGIGSTILRVLPLANPFAWVRDTFVAPGQIRKHRTPRAAG